MQRELMERKMEKTLIKWLGFDKPPQQRVSHKLWGVSIHKQHNATCVAPSILVIRAS